MIFTKITRIQWQHPTELSDQICLRIEENMFFMRPDIIKKTRQWFVKFLDNNVIERPWTDQESAEEFIKNRQSLAVKYNGKILDFEIIDID
jgi:hypothetical protein